MVENCRLCPLIPARLKSAARCPAARPLSPVQQMFCVRQKIAHVRWPLRTNIECIEPSSNLRALQVGMRTRKE
eukprot:6172004-Pleurochrysis_carterae.AAC.4